MRSLILFALVFTVAGVVAQDRTLGSGTKENTRKAEVLVIPNNPVMYRSDADRDFSQHNHLPASQVREFFRREVAEELGKQARHPGGTLVLHPADPISAQDLQYIYLSTGYKAEPLPEPEPQEAKAKNDKLFPGQQTRQEGGTRIEKGEVVSPAQQEEKHMKTTVTNENLLSTLNKSYGSKLFLFIGEIDVVLAADTRQEDIMRNTYSREIRVHYTLISHTGETVYSGVARETFPGRMLDLNKIKVRCFPSLASQMATRLHSTP